MTKLVLFILFALPVVMFAQTPVQTPMQPESTRVASNSQNNPGIDGGVSSRATATLAMATRATTAPVLDGKTDDPAWQNAQVIDQFLQ